ncbi:MAG: ribonuclease HII [Acidiferrobacteraceae bacterium]
MRAARLVAGIDEAGVGPLAGPVLAAAVVLHSKRPVAGVADSKTLSARRRIVLAAEIKQVAVCWALGRADVEEIDRLNILQAALLAMKRAVDGLLQLPSLALVDGVHRPALACPVRAIIHGDALVPEISAASILAKVARDLEMCEWHERYPVYDFQSHKGYGTRFHLDALRKYGPCPIHRRSFEPVRRVMDVSFQLRDSGADAEWKEVSGSGR